MARAYNQAQKFGVEMAIPDEVMLLGGASDDAAATTTRSISATARRVRARAVVMASGARYRRLDVDNLAEFEGSCVHYWASPIEARLCSGQEVALVGAGNSAGQAAVYLASQVRKVWLLARGQSLDASMSRYLVDRIAGAAECRGADRDRDHRAGRPGRHARSRPLAQPRTGEETRSRSAISSCSSAPSRTPTGWRSATSRSTPRASCAPAPRWARGATPLETSRSGVFAIGDVRAGSVKRVAAAVGEGAQVVAALHAYLAQAGGHAARPALPAEGLMADECTHAAGVRDVTPSALGCEECLKIGFALGASAAVPHLRPCRLLRQLAQPPRHQAFPRDRPSDHRGL